MEAPVQTGGIELSPARENSTSDVEPGRTANLSVSISLPSVVRQSDVDPEKALSTHDMATGPPAATGHAAADAVPGEYAEQLYSRTELEHMRRLPPYIVYLEQHDVLERIRMRIEAPAQGGGSALTTMTQCTAERRKSAFSPEVSETGRFLHLPGRIVHRMGPMLALPTLLLIAFGGILVIYGVIPLGDEPASPNRRNQRVFHYVLLPAVTTVFAWLQLSLLFGTLNTPRPFRRSPLSVLIVWGAEICALAFVDIFSLLGLVAIIVALVTSFACTAAVQRFRGAPDPLNRRLFRERFRQYINILAMLVVWIGIMAGYIVAFRNVDGATQSALPPLLQFVLFFVRKICLSLTDPFPIEMAMLMSSFLFENIDDMFQVFAYPQIDEYLTFIAVWFTNMASNLLILGFITRPWFRFRLWIKNWLKHVFACRYPIPAPPPAHEKENNEDRGHSANRIGYLRRQTRFFYWKVISQLLASVFYLFVAPILRFGHNADHFIMAEVTTAQFERSMFFAGGNMFFIVLSGAIGLFFVQKKIPHVLDFIVKTEKRNFASPTYLGYIVAIVASNGLLAIAIVTKQFRIWYGFRDLDSTGIDT